ncbi:hypothetical protein JXA80_03195 [bacterium]|nr:hypothetical protein [candidate division CSSED10-310 bacterium]
MFHTPQIISHIAALCAPLRHTSIVLTLIPAVLCPAAAVYSGDIDLWLDMYETEMSPGDSFTLEIVTMNTGDPIPETAFCLLLDIGGQFWCWPSWKSMLDGRTFLHPGPTPRSGRRY